MYTDRAMDAEAEEKEGEKLYTWETKYERTWYNDIHNKKVVHVWCLMLWMCREGIREDAEGLLKAEDEAEAYKIKRRKYANSVLYIILLRWLLLVLFGVSICALYLLHCVPVREVC